MTSPIPSNYTELEFFNEFIHRLDPNTGEQVTKEDRDRLLNRVDNMEERTSDLEQELIDCQVVTELTEEQVCYAQELIESINSVCLYPYIHTDPATKILALINDSSFEV